MGHMEAPHCCKSAPASVLLITFWPVQLPNIQAPTFPQAEHDNLIAIPVVVLSMCFSEIYCLWKWKTIHLPQLIAGDKLILPEYFDILQTGKHDGLKLSYWFLVFLAIHNSSHRSVQPWSFHNKFSKFEARENAALALRTSLFGRQGSVTPLIYSSS